MGWREIDGVSARETVEAVVYSACLRAKDRLPGLAKRNMLGHENAKCYKCSDPPSRIAVTCPVLLSPTASPKATAWCYRSRLLTVVGNGQFKQTPLSHIRQIVKRSISEVSCLASTSRISSPSRFLFDGDKTSTNDATAEIREVSKSFLDAAPLAVRCKATSRPSFPGRRSTSRSETSRSTSRTVPECDRPRIRRSLSLVD